MRVLVTRPLDDARTTAGELAKIGHDALIAPLFTLRYLDGPELLADNTQAILVTSGNGVRAMARRSSRRDIPLFAVGSHTAAVARYVGFAQVTDASGDSASLARDVCRRLSPSKGPLALVTGKHTAPDMRCALEAAGFCVRACTIYEVEAVAALPAVACEALCSASLDAALLFSARSSRIFTDRVRGAGLADACNRLIACCISDPVARALDGLQFSSIRVAVRPNHEHLLALLDRGLP